MVDGANKEVPFDASAQRMTHSENKDGFAFISRILINNFRSKFDIESKAACVRYVKMSFGLNYDNIITQCNLNGAPTAAICQNVIDHKSDDDAFGLERRKCKLIRIMKCSLWNLREILKGILV